STRERRPRPRNAGSSDHPQQSATVNIGFVRVSTPPLTNGNAQGSDWPSARLGLPPRQARGSEAALRVALRRSAPEELAANDARNRQRMHQHRTNAAQNLVRFVKHAELPQYRRAIVVDFFAG